MRTKTKTRRPRIRTAAPDRLRDHLFAALRAPPKPKLSELKPSKGAPSTESAHPQRARHTRPEGRRRRVRTPPVYPSRALSRLDHPARARSARSRPRAPRLSPSPPPRAAFEGGVGQGAKKVCEEGARDVRATHKAEPRWARRPAKVGVLRIAGGLAARFVRGSEAVGCEE
jgi:hypothetical protein